MNKCLIIILSLILMAGCGAESSKTQQTQKPPGTKQPIETSAGNEKKSTSTAGKQTETKNQNTSEAKALSPDNSPDLNDLSLETITSIPDDELTGQDFIDSKACKETRLISQKIAPDISDLEKNTFWSDCFPNTDYGRFDDLTKDMLCYPYIITHYESVYIHAGIRYNPYKYSCFNIETGELLWSKSGILNMRFDKLSKKIICNAHNSNKTTCIEPSSGNVLWEGDFNYLESDGSKYFLAECSLSKENLDMYSTYRKIVLIGDINTGKIINEKLVEADADLNDRASYFDLYRFFNDKPVLKDSQGNELDWNWNCKEYLALDRPEKIINNLLFLPYCSGGFFPSIYLDCYDIDTGEKKWGFSISMDEGADIKDPDLYIIGNKILMQYAGFAMPNTYNYLFDIDGNRFEIPKGYRIDVFGKVKNIGSTLILKDLKKNEFFGLDVKLNKIEKIAPYKLSLGGKVYTTESDLSQSEPSTQVKLWSKENIFNNKNNFLDAIATDEWLAMLSINNDYNEKRDQLKIAFYSIKNGDLIKEMRLDFLFEKLDGYGVCDELHQSACLSIFNKKIIIQTQIGIYILGENKETLIKVTNNFVGDYQPPAKRHEGSGKHSSPIYEDPVTKPFTITNISDQTENIKIILPDDAMYIKITCEYEFELKPGESKEITHTINKSNKDFITNMLFPIMIQYNNQTESVFIQTALRFYPD